MGIQCLVVVPSYRSSEREREREKTRCVYMCCPHSFDRPFTSNILNNVHEVGGSILLPWRHFFSSLVINMYIRQRRKIRHSFFSFFAFELPAHALSHSVLHLVKMPVVHHRCIYIYICTSIFTSMSI